MPNTIPTVQSLRRSRRHLDRLNLRVEEIVGDMAAGCSLHRGLDRYRRVAWSLSDGEVVADDIARAVIQHPCIVGVGDCLFPDFSNELSQTFRHVGGEED